MPTLQSQDCNKINEENFLDMSTKTTEWLDCGDGTLRNMNLRAIKTRVVELKGFGRIFEVYDYSNEPEQNFDLIVNAPKVKRQRDELVEAVLKYIEWHGGCHEDDCPEDDTCDCRGKEFADRLNKILKEIRDL